MSEQNIYQAPAVEDSTLEYSQAPNLEKVARGQKMIIYAILVNIAVIALQVIEPALGILGIIAIVLSIIGVVTLAAGLGYGILSRIIYIILMFIPLVNLVILLILNARATRRLRAGGYRVGLMGASPPQPD